MPANFIANQPLVNRSFRLRYIQYHKMGRNTLVSGQTPIKKLIHFIERLRFTCPCLSDRFGSPEGASTRRQTSQDGGNT